MKIRCDACDKAEATVFCPADEAALCDGCDHRVHHANKLARKHVRFSLVHPSFKESPLCDVCQERRAFLFCKEDRAILCRECDLPIHKANEHTQQHNRFLLTGVKLSSSTPPPTTSKSKLPVLSSSSEAFSSPSIDGLSPASMHNNSDNGSISTSSISEYLETVPGWRVDEFLDPSGFDNNGGLTWNSRYF